MIFGAILAGGTGSRMHIADMPKQFLPLGDKPIIMHTLEKFLMSEALHSVYIGVHPDWINYMNDLIEKYIPESARERVIAVEGGTDRNGTILKIIEAIEKDNGESPENLIITHDSVRPFVTLRMIEENIEAVKRYGAVDTVVPAIDTIVVSKGGDFILDIPERKYIYQGQTPQSFNINLFKELYASLSDGEKAILTDACKICVVRDRPVFLVEGSYTNIKVTTPGDYKIAQAMVGKTEI